MVHDSVNTTRVIIDSLVLNHNSRRGTRAVQTRLALDSFPMPHIKACKAFPPTGPNLKWSSWVQLWCKYHTGLRAVWVYLRQPYNAVCPEGEIIRPLSGSVVPVMTEQPSRARRVGPEGAHSCCTCVITTCLTCINSAANLCLLADNLTENIMW